MKKCIKEIVNSSMTRNGFAPSFKGHSVYQSNSMNLSTTSSVYNPFLDEQSANGIIASYFRQVQIGEKVKNGKVYRKLTVPFILLFVNEQYKEAFLNYTSNSSNDADLNIRNILTNLESCNNYYRSIVKRIGDTYSKRGLRIFKLNSFIYTSDNCNNTGGERIKFYLDVSGQSIPEDSHIFDMTSEYQEILNSSMVSEVQSKSKKRA